MNINISIMIDLQKTWDEMASFQYEAERHGKSILHWREQARKAAGDVDALRGEIKKLSAHIKERELELGDSEAQIKKLEARRGLIKTEKELKALEHELALVSDTKGNVEEELLNDMDRLESLEKDLAVKVAENDAVQAQAKNDIAMLEEKTASCLGRAKELLDRFNVRIEDLQADLRSKFRKIITAKDGKAIARLTDNNCGACNTSIPVQMAIEASRNEKIMNCTNCGRFLYGAL